MYINCICFAACLCGSMDVIRDHVLSPKRIGCSTNMHVCTVMGRPDLERIQTLELKNNKKKQNLAEILEMFRELRIWARVHRVCTLYNCTYCTVQYIYVFFKLIILISIKPVNNN